MKLRCILQSRYKITLNYPMQDAVKLLHTTAQFCTKENPVLDLSYTILHYFKTIPIDKMFWGTDSFAHDSGMLLFAIIIHWLELYTNPELPNTHGVCIWFQCYLNILNLFFSHWSWLCNFICHLSGCIFKLRKWNQTVRCTLYTSIIKFQRNISI